MRWWRFGRRQTSVDRAIKAIKDHLSTVNIDCPLNAVDASFVPILMELNLKEINPDVLGKEWIEALDKKLNSLAEAYLRQQELRSFD